MRCAHCDTNNALGSRFCISCGAGLDKSCPSCGHTNPGLARFCAQCGTTLAEIDAAKSTVPRSDGELKQITVLFADISGSTELIETLDPEAAAKRLEPAIRVMQEAVHRFEGS